MCKMWSTKDGILLFCVWYIGCVSPSEEYCDYNYKGFGFNQSKVGQQPVEKISQKLVKPTLTVMKVVIEKKHADFNLTVLVIPSIKNQLDCPSDLNGKEDLQKYKMTCTVYKDTNERDVKYFWQISTGCYYFIATDAESNNWVWGPKFHNTSLPYYNAALKFGDKPNFKPEYIDQTMVLRFLLKIPLSCIKVRVQLFQLNGKIDALDDIRNMKIPGAQECWFTKNDTGVVYFDCKGSKLITNLTLEVTVYEENEKEKEREWTADVSWKGLQRGGGTYYLWIGPYTDICENLYGRANVTTWIPIYKDILQALDWVNKVDSPEKHEPTDGFQEPFIIYILCITLGVIVLAILAFRKCKYFTAFRKNPPENKIVHKLQESVLLHDENESHNILLMYAKDSPEFMKEMDIFRSLLKQACHCHVYDLYTINEWNSIERLGVTEWVEKLLRDGNKIVWVDTPRFRSRFSDQQDKLFSGDFRDDAIPYAVALTKNLFQNITTPYRFHFVVRVEGYEVNDELYPDPLQVVSPHTRYRIPEHLSLLYKDLQDPAMNLEKTEELSISNL